MRWGSHGRLNLIGALAWGKEKRTLHFELVEESVKSRTHELTRRFPIYS